MNVSIPMWVAVSVLALVMMAIFHWGRRDGIKEMKMKLLEAEAKQKEAERVLQKHLSKTAQEADHVVNNGDVVGELHKHGEIRPNE